MVLSGIRPSFPGLSRSAGQITHVLLTRSPLEYPASRAFPFDLHVLSTPAFVLSQDQTLHKSKISLTKSPTSLAKIQKLPDCQQSSQQSHAPSHHGGGDQHAQKQSSTPKLNSHSKNKKTVFNKPSRLPAPSPNHRATQPVRQKCLVCYAIEFSNNMQPDFAHLPTWRSVISAGHEPYAHPG